MPALGKFLLKDDIDLLVKDFGNEYYHDVIFEYDWDVTSIHKT